MSLLYKLINRRKYNTPNTQTISLLYKLMKIKFVLFKNKMASCSRNVGRQKIITPKRFGIEGVIFL